MLYPIAIEIGDDEHAYSVAVPDIKGCYSAGDTMDEALENAKEATNMHLELLAEMGQLPPTAKSLNYWSKDEEFKGWSWGIVDVNIEPYLGKSSIYR